MRYCQMLQPLYKFIAVAEAPDCVGAILLLCVWTQAYCRQTGRLEFKAQWFKTQTKNKIHSLKTKTRTKTQGLKTQTHSLKTQTKTQGFKTKTKTLTCEKNNEKILCTMYIMQSFNVQHSSQ